MEMQSKFLYGNNCFIVHADISVQKSSESSRISTFLHSAQNKYHWIQCLFSVSYPVS
uniref:Uncharacterized protein n=1 Tax=Arundo donax TaxID=35708 RepID=A0A0A8YN76_ARUDO